MFKLNEMENLFEIGRIIQALIDKGHIKYYESKEAFMDAMMWAIEFENMTMSDDYYWDIDRFVQNKCKEKGIME